MRSVCFSDGGSRDRDMIFGDRMYLVFLGLRGEVSGMWSKQLTKKRQLESWQLSLCAFFLSFFLSFSLALFLFFSFFPPTFSIFSRSNAHTHTNKGVDFQKGLFVRFNMARDEKFAKDLVRSTCSKSNKGGGKRRGKAESRQIYGSLLHSICGLQINVWLGAFI